MVNTEGEIYDVLLNYSVLYHEVPVLMSLLNAQCKCVAFEDPLWYLQKSMCDLDVYMFFNDQVISFHFMES